MQEIIDEKLHELFIATGTQDDPQRAKWVLWAVEWYINTGRAGMDFLQKFIKVDAARFPGIISKCLRGDCSTDGIMKNFKRAINK